MQRWLASQKQTHPVASIAFGLAMIAVAVSIISTPSDIGRYGGYYVQAAFIAVGVWALAIGIAALRERRSASDD